MTTTTATIAAPQQAAVRPAAIASNVIWTAAGVGSLALLGKGILAMSKHYGLTEGCWQLTGARAAAVTLTLGTLVAARRGNVALFGLLYGGWLYATHPSTAALSSALIAGVVALFVAMSLAGRAMAVRLVATVLSFNLLLTLGSLFNHKHDWAGYSSGLGLRAIATLLVCAAIVGVSKLVRQRHVG